MRVKSRNQAILLKITRVKDYPDTNQTDEAYPQRRTAGGSCISQEPRRCVTATWLGLCLDDARSDEEDQLLARR